MHHPRWSNQLKSATVLDWDDYRPVQSISSGATQYLLPGARMIATATLAALLCVIVVLAVLRANTGGDATPSASGWGELRGPLSMDEGAPAVALEPAAVQQQPVTIPVHPIRTGLMLLHVLGLALGLGSALFLDLYLVAHLYHRPIGAHMPALVHFGSRLVAGGLALLWLTGLGFLAFYYFNAPQALENPKLLAKFAIVALLTLNGGLIHRVVMPRMSERIGLPLLQGETMRRALIPLAAGTVSSASWAFACTLGLVKEMNHIVPAWMLLGCYAVLVLAGVTVALLAHSHLSGRPATMMSPRLQKALRVDVHLNAHRAA